MKVIIKQFIGKNTDTVAKNLLSAMVKEAKSVGKSNTCIILFPEQLTLTDITGDLTLTILRILFGKRRQGRVYREKSGIKSNDATIRHINTLHLKNCSRAVLLSIIPFLNTKETRYLNELVLDLHKSSTLEPEDIIKFKNTSLKKITIPNLPNARNIKLIRDLLKHLSGSIELFFGNKKIVTLTDIPDEKEEETKDEKKDDSKDKKSDERTESLKEVKKGDAPKKRPLLDEAKTSEMKKALTQRWATEEFYNETVSMSQNKVIVRNKKLTMTEFDNEIKSILSKITAGKLTEIIIENVTIVSETKPGDIARKIAHLIKLHQSSLRSISATLLEYQLPGGKFSYLNDGDIEILAEQLKKANELIKMDFSHNDIGNLGLSILANVCKIKPGTPLAELILANNLITAVGFRSLPAAIRGFEIPGKGCTQLILGTDLQIREHLLKNTTTESIRFCKERNDAVAELVTALGEKNQLEVLQLCFDLEISHVIDILQAITNCAQTKIVKLALLDLNLQQPESKTVSDRPALVLAIVNLIKINRTLKFLSIEDNNFTEEELVQIQGAIESNPVITYVFMANQNGIAPERRKIIHQQVEEKLLNNRRAESKELFAALPHPTEVKAYAATLTKQDHNACSALVRLLMYQTPDKIVDLLITIGSLGRVGYEVIINDAPIILKVLCIHFNENRRDNPILRQFIHLLNAQTTADLAATFAHVDPIVWKDFSSDDPTILRSLARIFLRLFEAPNSLFTQLKDFNDAAFECAYDIQNLSSVSTDDYKIAGEIYHFLAKKDFPKAMYNFYRIKLAGADGLPDQTLGEQWRAKYFDLDGEEDVAFDDMEEFHDKSTKDAISYLQMDHKREDKNDQDSDEDEIVLPPDTTLATPVVASEMPDDFKIYSFPVHAPSIYTQAQAYIDGRKNESAALAILRNKTKYAIFSGNLLAGLFSIIKDEDTVIKLLTTEMAAILRGDDLVRIASQGEKIATYIFSTLKPPRTQLTPLQIVKIAANYPRLAEEILAGTNPLLTGVILTSEHYLILGSRQEKVANTVLTRGCLPVPEMGKLGEEHSETFALVVTQRILGEWGSTKCTDQELTVALSYLVHYQRVADKVMATDPFIEKCEQKNESSLMILAHIGIYHPRLIGKYWHSFALNHLEILIVNFTLAKKLLTDTFYATKITSEFLLKIVNHHPMLVFDVLLPGSVEAKGDFPNWSKVLTDLHLLQLGRGYHRNAKIIIDTPVLLERIISMGERYLWDMVRDHADLKQTLIQQGLVNKIPIDMMDWSIARTAIDEMSSIDNMYVSSSVLYEICYRYPGYAYELYTHPTFYQIHQVLNANQHTTIACRNLDILNCYLDKKAGFNLSIFNPEQCLRIVSEHHKLATVLGSVIPKSPAAITSGSASAVDEKKEEVKPPDKSTPVVDEKKEEKPKDKDPEVKRIEPCWLGRGLELQHYPFDQSKLTPKNYSIGLVIDFLSYATRSEENDATYYIEVVERLNKGSPIDIERIDLLQADQDSYKESAIAQQVYTIDYTRVKLNHKRLKSIANAILSKWDTDPQLCIVIGVHAIGITYNKKTRIATLFIPHRGFKWFLRPMDDIRFRHELIEWILLTNNNSSFNIQVFNLSLKTLTPSLLPESPVKRKMGVIPTRTITPYEHMVQVEGEMANCLDQVQNVLVQDKNVEECKIALTRLNAVISLDEKVDNKIQTKSYKATLADVYIKKILLQLKINEFSFEEFVTIFDKLLLLLDTTDKIVTYIPYLFSLLLDLNILRTKTQYDIVAEKIVLFLNQFFAGNDNAVYSLLINFIAKYKSITLDKAAQITIFQKFHYFILDAIPDDEFSASVRTGAELTLKFYLTFGKLCCSNAQDDLAIKICDQVINDPFENDYLSQNDLMTLKYARICCREESKGERGKSSRQDYCKDILAHLLPHEKSVNGVAAIAIRAKAYQILGKSPYQFPGEPSVPDTKFEHVVAKAANILKELDSSFLTSEPGSSFLTTSTADEILTTANEFYTAGLNWESASLYAHVLENKKVTNLVKVDVMRRMVHAKTWVPVEEQYLGFNQVLSFAQSIREGATLVNVIKFELASFIFANCRHTYQKQGHTLVCELYTIALPFANINTLELYALGAKYEVASTSIYYSSDSSLAEALGTAKRRFYAGKLFTLKVMSSESKQYNKHLKDFLTLFLSTLENASSDVFEGTLPPDTRKPKPGFKLFMYETSSQPASCKRGGHSTRFVTTFLDIPEELDQQRFLYKKNLKLLRYYTDFLFAETTKLVLPRKLVDNGQGYSETREDPDSVEISYHQIRLVSTRSELIAFFIKAIELECGVRKYKAVLMDSVIKDKMDFSDSTRFDLPLPSLEQAMVALKELKNVCDEMEDEKHVDKRTNLLVDVISRKEDIRVKYKMDLMEDNDLSELMVLCRESKKALPPIYYKRTYDQLKNRTFKKPDEQFAFYNDALKTLADSKEVLADTKDDTEFSLRRCIALAKLRRVPLRLQVTLEARTFLTNEIVLGDLKEAERAFQTPNDKSWRVDIYTHRERIGATVQGGDITRYNKCIGYADQYKQLTNTTELRLKILLSRELLKKEKELGYYNEVLPSIASVRSLIKESTDTYGTNHRLEIAEINNAELEANYQLATEEKEVVKKMTYVTSIVHRLSEEKTCASSEIETRLKMIAGIINFPELNNTYLVQVQEIIKWADRIATPAGETKAEYPDLMRTISLCAAWAGRIKCLPDLMKDETVKRIAVKALQFMKMQQVAAAKKLPATSTATSSGTPPPVPTSGAGAGAGSSSIPSPRP